MSKGKASVTYLGRAGMVTPQTVPSWDFIYETSTIKHPKYELGHRIVLPDGREFRYAKSDAECYAGQAVEFFNTGFQKWGPIIVSQVAGDKQITMTGGEHDAVDKDELRGGYIFISDPVTDNARVQFRGIIGNDKAAQHANVTVYLDGKLSSAVTPGAHACEVFKNPYSAIRLAGGMTTDSRGKPGVAATYVDVADKYFWIQTKGPAWLSSHASLIDRDVGATWRHDGTLEGMSTVVNGSICGVEHTSQYAGYSMVGNHDGNGPLFMLQG